MVEEQVVIHKAHLEYLTNDFGFQGFMKEFKQQKTLSFMRWINDELTKNSSTNKSSIKIKIPTKYYDIAVYGLSVVAYKIICDSVGKDKAVNVLDIINRLKNQLNEGG